jgi:hypothetical protein
LLLRSHVEPSLGFNRSNPYVLFFPSFLGRRHLVRADLARESNARKGINCIVNSFNRHTLVPIKGPEVEPTRLLTGCPSSLLVSHSSCSPSRKAPTVLMDQSSLFLGGMTTTLSGLRILEHKSHTAHSRFPGGQRQAKWFRLAVAQ